jgi:glycosyltransferase 2 family protein
MTATATAPHAGRRIGLRWARVAAGAAIVSLLVWRIGPAPFVAGIRDVDPGLVLAVLAITTVTTACSAWRWTAVAHGLGTELGVLPAIAAYYRAQFLNTVLPGGVLGDAHRGVLHGREVGDVGAGLRAVVWERVAGQAVQLLVTLAVLCALPSPVRTAMPFAVAGAAVVTGGVVLAARSPRRLGREMRAGVLRRWPLITGTSLVVVAGHTGTLLLATRAAGVTASPTVLLPLLLLVLSATAVPLNIGGWGPREGVAAWVFGAAGFGAAAGVTVATVYGLLTLVAVLPGAFVLALDPVGRRAEVRHD